MRRVLGLVGLAAVVAGCTSAQAAPSGTAAGSGGASRTPASAASADPVKAADVRSIIRTAMDTYKLKAVIVRVTIDGKDVITEAFGDSMTGVPASTRDPAKSLMLPGVA